MKDLHAVMAQMATQWTCDATRYPALAGMTEDQRLNFLMKHSLLHIGKTTGKIAEICQEFDHQDTDGDMRRQDLKYAAFKLFLNSLKLAEEAGLTADDLLTHAPDYI